MKRLIRVLIPCLALLVLVSCAYIPKRNRDASVLVVPARYAMVQFAFDVARIRPVTLVAYDKGREPGSVLMHVWNPNLREWTQIDMAEYRSGSFAMLAPKRVHILGSHQTGLPSGLIESSNWAPVVSAVPSLNLMDIVNDLDTYMLFTGKEWRWIAQRHGLKIEDGNVERRKYGRYGKPGEKKSGVPMPSEMDEMSIYEPMPVVPATMSAPVAVPEPAPVSALVDEPMASTDTVDSPVESSAGVMLPEDK